MKKIKFENMLSVIATTVILGMMIFSIAKTSPSNDQVGAAYQPSMNASQIVADTTHEFVTDDQIAAWNALLNPTVISSTFQSLVSQSGTSAPTGNTLHSDFGATTFTWARTGTGTYTLTASTPTFTAGKTGVFMAQPVNFLNNYKSTVTSSTVITFQTATLSVITLILTPGNADSLLSNTMIYVVVYP